MKNGELDMELIWNDIQNFGYLLMVSDGLVHYIYSIFFWCIVANLKGQWLTVASGLSIGSSSSLNSKGYGILSSALFLSIIEH